MTNQPSQPEQGWTPPQESMTADQWIDRLTSIADFLAPPQEMQGKEADELEDMSSDIEYLANMVPAWMKCYNACRDIPNPQEAIPEMAVNIGALSNALRKSRDIARELRSEVDDPVLGAWAEDIDCICTQALEMVTLQSHRSHEGPSSTSS